jgi:hypothetical protein
LPDKMKTTLYLDRELWKQVKRRGIDEGEPATRIVEKAIAEYLKNPRP